MAEAIPSYPHLLPWYLTSEREDDIIKFVAGSIRRVGIADRKDYFMDTRTIATTEEISTAPARPEEEEAITEEEEAITEEEEAITKYEQLAELVRDGDFALDGYLEMSRFPYMGRPLIDEVIDGTFSERYESEYREPPYMLLEIGCYGSMIRMAQELSHGIRAALRIIKSGSHPDYEVALKAMDGYIQTLDQLEDLILPYADM